jgi:hypothetical protein
MWAPNGLGPGANTACAGAQFPLMVRLAGVYPITH